MKRQRMFALMLLCLLCAPLSNPFADTTPLRIGVTLHPYYSWVACVVADSAEVVALIPADEDPHSFQPRPGDMATMATLDAIVLNDLGHDAFVQPMLRALDNDAIHLIHPNQGLPLIRAETDNSDATAEINSHTFLSITGAVHQINVIVDQLSHLDPPNAHHYHTNGRAYLRHLRGLLGDALSQLRNHNVADIRIATVHDGYRYLLEELGLTVSAVIQPRHGFQPSPKQLADTVKRIRSADIDILFVEADYDSGVAAVVKEEAGARLYRLSHVSSGPYSADKFEQDMAANLATIVKAITDD